MKNFTVRFRDKGTFDIQKSLYQEKINKCFYAECVIANYNTECYSGIVDSFVIV